MNLVERATLEYHPIAKTLHWALVVLIAIQYITSWVMTGVRTGTPDLFFNLHMSFGLLAFPLALLLFVMRLVRPVVKLETPAPKWTAKASTLMHYLLYTLLILLPFSGWAYATTHGIAVSVFGLFTPPSLFGATSSFANSFGELHGGFAGAIIFLAGIHFAAALYHHFWLKDPVLKRMLPNTQRAQSSDVQNITQTDG